MNDIEIRQMAEGEDAKWGALRSKLWPDCLEDDNRRDAEAFRLGKSALKIVLVAFDGDVAIGFAEISERSVVDGAGNDPAAHLEGWYVEPVYRCKGIGGRLIALAADWARQHGYQYFGSDVELDNIVSQQAHAALGFEETGRVVNYLMALTA